MSICHITTSRKYDSDSHRFEINVTIQTLIYNCFDRFAIETVKSACQRGRVWRDGWLDGQQMHRDASARWRLIEL